MVAVGATLVVAQLDASWRLDWAAIRAAPTGRHVDVNVHVIVHDILDRKAGDVGAGVRCTAMSADAPVPEAQERGFLVVKQPSDWWAAFRASSSQADDADEYRAHLAHLHEVLGVRPDAYRGVDRVPINRSLGGYADAARGRLPERAKEIMAASELIWNRLGSEYPDWNFDADLVPDLTLAREVKALTKAPTAWEIIAVSRTFDDGASESSLGFDVAQWGGDHLSIVRESMLGPRHFGSSIDSLPELVPFAERLNATMLFDDVQDALAFRSWSLRQDWACVSKGYEDEYQLILISEVS